MRRRPSARVYARAKLGGALTFLMLLGCAHGAGGPAGSVAEADAAGAKGASYTTAASGSVLLGDATDADARAAIGKACKRAGLTVDERLARLALAVAEASQGGSIPPRGAFVNHHAQRQGLVEPTPQLWLAGAPERDMLLEMAAEAVRDAAKTSRLTHCGGALIRAEGRLVMALALSSRFVTLERAIPRRLERGQKLVVRAKLARGYHRPTLALTAPNGQVARNELADAAHVAVTLAFDKRGEHTLELLAEGPEGIGVLAVFPVFVGSAPPSKPPPYADEPAETSVEAVTRNLEALIAKERKQRGLPPLQGDARLAAVARAHSEDMKANHFVAHTSRRTGAPSDRVTRAGLRASLLLENIGRGYSAAEIHRGLMDSPGHRGNILHPDARDVGLGVVAESEGSRQAFLVTELFARLSKPLDLDAAREELLAALEQRRKQRRLRDLTLDAQLSQIAQKAAERYARGEERRDRVLLDQAMSQVQKPPKGVAHLGATMVLAEEAGAVAEGAPLQGAALRTLGVGIAELGKDASHRYVVVLLLGSE